jgi:glucosamine-6-phosphate deaminase
MKLEVYDTEQALAHALAVSVASAIADHPDIVLGLPTGRTPIALYRELVTLTRERGLDWSRVRTFNLDEFVGLGDNAPGSYRRFMHEHLFQHLNVPSAHIGFLDGRAADLDAEADRYERAIRDAGGIDLMILGIGSNGHIGFNEPCDVLPARTHKVTLEEPSRAGNALWFGGDVNAVPRQALSIGMATILNAREVVLMATGEGKADAVNEMVTGGITTRLPASFLQLHPHVTVMLDDDAAACLGARAREERNG